MAPAPAMMTRALRLVLCALLAVQFAAASGASETHTTVRISTGEWPPYTSQAAPFYGVASHIVTEAFAAVGIVAEYGFFPWPRAMKLAREGEWDGTSIWFDTPERRQSFHYSEPIVVATNAFFFLKGSDFSWRDFADLADLRVGGTLEYSYGTDFDAAEAAGVFQTQRSRSDEAGLANLLKGRIDVFPGELLVTYAQLEKGFDDEVAARITHSPKPISIQPLYLLLNKKDERNARLLGLFNDGLKRLKESGRYDQILADALGNAGSTAD